MQRYIWCFLLMIGIVQLATPQGQLPAEVVNDLKASTVQIKVLSPNLARVDISASGFLIHKDGTTGTIVTNTLIVPPPRGGLPTSPYIDVVFNGGRAKEVTYEAEAIAWDTKRALTFLRIKNAKDLPKPLDVSKKAELAETTPVFISGFPFGKALSPKENPAVTIGRGTIASVKEGKDGSDLIVQIDGGINPGTNGGPIVNEKGELVGVALAGVAGTKIGFAIAPVQLTKAMEAYAFDGFLLKSVTESSKETDLFVRVTFHDPLGKIKNPKIHLLKCKFEDGKPVPKIDYTKKFAPVLEGSKAYDLKMTEQYGRARIIIPNTDKEKSALYYVQVSFTDENGKTVALTPREWGVGFNDNYIGNTTKLVLETDRQDLPPRPYVFPELKAPDIRKGKYTRLQDEDFKDLSCILPKSEINPIDPVQVQGEPKALKVIESQANLSPFVSSPDGKLVYFINRKQRLLQVIDMEKQALEEKSLQLPHGCEHLAITPDGKKIFVSITSGHVPRAGKTTGQIMAVNTKSLTESMMYTIPQDPYSLLVIDDFVYASTGNRYDETLFRLDYTKEEEFALWEGSMEFGMLGVGKNKNRIFSTYPFGNGSLRVFIPPTEPEMPIQYFDVTTGPESPLRGAYSIFPTAEKMVFRTGYAYKIGEEDKKLLSFSRRIDEHNASFLDAEKKKIWTVGKQLNEYDQETLKPVAGYVLPNHGFHAAFHPKSRTVVVAAPDPDSKTPSHDAAKAEMVLHFYNLDKLAHATDKEDNGETKFPKIFPAPAKSLDPVRFFEGVQPREKYNYTKLDNIDPKGDAKPVKEIEIKGSISPFVKDSKDKYLYFVNRTTKKLHRVDLAKRELDELSSELPFGCENVAISGDDKTLFVNITEGHELTSPKREVGRILLLDATTLKRTRMIDIPLDPENMLELNQKLYVTGGSRQPTVALEIDYKSKEVQPVKWAGFYPGTILKAGPKLDRMYVLSTNTTRTISCYLLPEKADQPAKNYESPYGGLPEMMGRFEVFPDIGVAVCARGPILNLKEKPTEDLRLAGTIHPHFNSVYSKKDKQLYTMGEFLTVYSVPDFKAQARYKLPKLGLYSQIHSESNTLVVAGAILKPEEMAPPMGFKPDARFKAPVMLQFFDLANPEGK